MATSSSKRRTFGVCLLVVSGLWALYYYRLALVSDAFVARKLSNAVAQANSAENARVILERHYKVSSVGSGNPWGESFAVPEDARCFTALVGEYRIVFVTSVEALVVFSPKGALQRVFIRRTVDAL